MSAATVGLDLLPQSLTQTVAANRDVEGIGGPKPMTPDRNSPLARCHKAEQELGLRCHIIMDTLKDTIDTLIAFGAIDGECRFARVCNWF